MENLSVRQAPTLDSREVAEMIGKLHKNLLRDIDGYIEILTGSKLSPSDFFIQSSYQDSKGETRPCFLLTKMGCEMVANKLTGRKGVLFTAAYVKKFNDMEKQPSKVVPLSKDQALVTVLRTTADLVEDNQAIKAEQHEIRKLITQVDDKVESQITLDHGEQRQLQKVIARRVYELEPDDQKRRSKIFHEIYRELKDRFAVGSYKDILRKELSDAIRFVEAFIPKRVA